MSAVAELLRLIERLEDLHTEVQGRISFPHLATALLFDVLQRWSWYLNRYVAALASEVEEAMGASVHFSLKPILVELEGGSNIDQIPPDSLAEHIKGRQTAGGSAPKGGVGSRSRHADVGGGGGFVSVFKNPFRRWRPQGDKHK